MKFRIAAIVYFIGIIYFFPTCKSDKHRVEESPGSSEDLSFFKTLGDEPEIIRDIHFLFPLHDEIIEDFFNTDLEYKPGLVNSVENRDSYLGPRSQALNLGIYLTDLAYSVKYGLADESVDYLEAVSSLSKQIGVSTEVFESLLDRARANISNSDSIVSISNEACYKMFNFLEASKKENILGIISTGAYIESLYLVLETKDEFNEDDPVFAQISILKYPFDILLSVARKSEDEENATSLFKYLNSINHTFEQLAVEGTETTTTKTEGKLINSGGAAFTLSSENFKEIKSAIRSIRTEITGI